MTRKFSGMPPVSDKNMIIAIKTAADILGYITGQTQPSITAVAQLATSPTPTNDQITAKVNEVISKVNEVISRLQGT